MLCHRSTRLDRDGCGYFIIFSSVCSVLLLTDLSVCSKVVVMGTIMIIIAFYMMVVLGCC